MQNEIKPEWRVGAGRVGMAGAGGGREMQGIHIRLIPSNTNCKVLNCDMTLHIFKSVNTISHT